MIEIWLIYRQYFIRKANETKGFMGIVWYVLTLGITEHNPESVKIDHKLAAILAGIGIPWACILHGYVGFVFGSVKAVAWWATALQPFIFLSSAVVSGMAILFLMYTFIKWRRREDYDYPLVRKFMAFLWGMFILDYALEVLELAFVVYERGHHWSQVEPLLKGPLYHSYFVGQMGILSFVPLLVLGYVVLSSIRGRMMVHLANFGCLLLLFQVLVMRFNVVIGGQLISKSERGFVDFHWEILGKEGVLTALALLAAPIVTYYVISRFIPIFEGDKREKEA
jgi:predicted membrane protein